jgi:hypothetical protein
MEDDLNIFLNARRPQFFSRHPDDIWKITSFSFQNGRRPNFLTMEDHLNFLKMEDNHFFLEMEDDIFFVMEDHLLFFKWKITSIFLSLVDNLQNLTTTKMQPKTNTDDLYAFLIHSTVHDS